MAIRHKQGRRTACILALLGLFACLGPSLWAGVVGRQGAVGGVSISAEGLVGAIDLSAQRQLREELAKAVKPVPSDLKQFSKLRKISLRGLEAALAEHHQNNNTKLPQTIQMLAGLQQIQYIFVYPELNDIVLAGPAEGWQVDNQGEVVGITTGKPVMRLDDLLVALRYAREGAVQCSIDPTEKGLASLRSLASRLGRGSNPQVVMKQIEDTLGPQVISVGGVPDSSHFARVMVAADFRMKRLAMNFEQAPVRDMPSYLHLAQVDRGGLQNMLPRWWLAPKASPLQTTSDKMAWELKDLGVQCKTEEDFLKEDGTRQHSGKAGSAAQKWADTFTDKYEELAARQNVFAELRNLIDLSVVGAVIHKHNLLDVAGLEAKYLMSEEVIDQYDVPRRVDSKASVLRKGNGWLISASGGVQMYPADLVSDFQESDTLAPVRKEAMAKNMNWWWD